MRFYARPEYSYLRWRTLPMNLLGLFAAPPIYLAFNIGVAIVDAAKNWASDIREVYGAFK